MKSGIPATKGNSNLIQTIIAEIERVGPLTFARFMDLALYDQENGYYMTKSMQESDNSNDARERIGWSGDFYTAPDVHPLLAKAIFNQVQEVDDLLNHPSRMTVLEMGGGKGFLARDFLRECESQVPEMVSRLTYIFIERSPNFRRTQETQLREFVDKGWSIRWAGSLSELTSHEVTGVIFSNEFVDALTVHRVTVQGGILQEVFVEFRDGGFRERLDQLSTQAIQEYFDHIHIQLPEGYTTEVHLEAMDWIKEVARVLNRGVMLTIDYGHTAQDYYGPQRRRGTLLGYHRHTVVDNPYLHIGEQDLTAHVNFSGLALVGQRVGLSVTGYTNLMNFLFGLGAEEILSELDQESEELQSAIQLLRPNGMGSTYKVFIQHAGMEVPCLRGLRFRPFFEGSLLGVGSETQTS